MIQSRVHINFVEILNKCERLYCTYLIQNLDSTSRMHMIYEVQVQPIICQTDMVESTFILIILKVAFIFKCYNEVTRFSLFPGSLTF